MLTPRGRRFQLKDCPECGKPIRGASTECMGCLRKFHASCLVRVKKAGWGVSYRMCNQCLQERPGDRFRVDAKEK
jgi:hypothetical protein